MADWVRNAIMLTVLAVWAIYMIVTLARGSEPNAIVWGVVPSVWFALNPNFKKGKQDGPS